MRRLVIGIGVLVLAVVAAGAIRSSLNDEDGAQSAGPVPSLPTQPAVAGVPTAATELGVFEPIRGWIVYPVGDGLKAVNPDDPTEQHTLELPEGLDAFLGGGPDGGNRPSPAGWTADGTKLALSSEYSGDHFVMNADGTLRRVDLGQGGCCIFVTNPWLSSDGATGAMGVTREGVRYVDVVGNGSDVRKLEPALPAGNNGWGIAWSADGPRFAFVTVADELTGTKPTLNVADFTSGTRRVLSHLDAAYVRHLVWSPDGSQILVVAGVETLPRNVSLNPLVSPQPTKLLLVESDGSGSREIASGYYVATAWSPDGKEIAAIEYLGDRRLVVMDADSTDQRVLVELPGSELFTGLAWHPLPAKG